MLKFFYQYHHSKNGRPGKKTAILLALLGSVLFMGITRAAEDRKIGFFTLQFADGDESYNYLAGNQSKTGLSTGAFSEEQKRAIEEAAGYWAQRIIPNGIDSPDISDGAKRQVVIRVVFSDSQKETTTYINTITTDSVLKTTAYDILTQGGNPDVSKSGGYDALIVIGSDVPAATPSRLAMDGDSLTAVTLQAYPRPDIFGPSPKHGG